MTKSSSILLLELEDLKDHMSRVQAELSMQSEEVCGVLARLETVTAIVRAVQTVGREKKVVGEGNSFSDPIVDNFEDNVNVDIAEKEGSYCAFKEGEQHFPLLGEDSSNQVEKYPNEECIISSQLHSPSCNTESMQIFETSEQELAVSGFDETGDERDVTSATVKESVASEENVGLVNIVSDNLDCLETVLPSTRPSLSRNRRKNNKDKRDMPEDNDSINATTDTTLTASNTATQASRSENSCIVPSNPKMSSLSSVTSAQTSSSMKESTSSMVNRVKEICTRQGWCVEGCYSSREGKEGCGVVHFYRLDVKGGVMDMMTRGVGVSKVEAVRRAFKTMENRLKQLKCEGLELDKKVEPARLKKEDYFGDNIVNFPDEEPVLTVKSKSSSEVSFSPPVFHARDCISRDQVEVKGGLNFPTELVETTLTVSDRDAGAIIGTKGTNIKSIIEETDVIILVQGLMNGKKDRLVELKGKKPGVDKAVEMIKNIIKKC